jgi:uncharacterized protein YecT (DUF1311 family)
MVAVTASKPSFIPSASAAGIDTSWKQLDAAKPDSNKPVMASQTAWLSAEAAKLGKGIDELTRSDIIALASRPGSPGPSEIARLKDNVAANPREDAFGSGPSAGSWRPAGPTPVGGSVSPLATRLGGLVTQADMNIAAGDQRKAAEARLETIVEGQIAQTPDIEGKGRLKREAFAFLGYAEAAADFAGSAVKGGSLEPFTRATTLAELMNQRSDMLEASSQEGVVAYGSSGGAGLSTQTGMNQDAGFTLQAARAELSSVIERIDLRLQGSPRAAAFASSNARFADYVAAASDRAGAKVAGGSLEPLARAGMEEALVRERTAMLRKSLDSLLL